jgi:hypothetical protein
MVQFLLGIPEIVLYGCVALIAVALVMSIAVSRSALQLLMCISVAIDSSLICH